MGSPSRFSAQPRAAAVDGDDGTRGGVRFPREAAGAPPDGRPASLSGPSGRATGFPQRAVRAGASLSAAGGGLSG